MAEKLALATKMYVRGRQDTNEGMTYYDIALRILEGSTRQDDPEYVQLKRELSRKLGRDADSA